MIYILVKALGFPGALKIFNQLEFRAISAFLLAFVIVMLFGNRVIMQLMKMKIGDAPEFHNAAINELMKKKENTPTMGGIILVGAILISSLLLGDITREHGFYLWAGLICLVAHGAIGFGDDWMKLTFARRAKASGGKATRDGLKSWEKLLFQLVLATVLCWFVYDHAAHKYTILTDESNKEWLKSIKDMSTCINVPGIKTWVFDHYDAATNRNLLKVSSSLHLLGPITFVVLGVLFVAGMSNAVNLTDGMDGLAGGISTIACLALMVLALIAGYENTEGVIWAKNLLLPFIPDSGELSILAGAMAGACLGFLWFNCNPAQVFMGDTGSLSLGGTMGFIAVVTRQEFLLILIGGVFILEGLSVAIQVAVFRFSKGTIGFHNVKGTRRVFLCAPFHHHLHLKGWTEQKIVVRLWLVTALLAAAALATIKMR